MTFHPHELRAGTDVFSRDGEKLGALHRVVVRHSDLGLTHVVVDIGFLRSGRALWEGGLGLDYDRIVPIDQIQSASDQRIELDLSAAEFKDSPEYTDETFEQAWDLTPGEFDIPDVVNRAEAFSAIVGGVSNVWLVQRLNKPLDSVDIVDGTDVWRQQPHEKLGDVKRVLLDPEDNRLRALVIRRGFLLKHDVVLPVRYISELLDDLIRVEISNQELAELPEYREAN